MKTYHKIKTLWAREDTKPHNMIVGKFAEPEFELLKDIKWVGTEKIDGTNVRVMWNGNNVSFNGKTDNAQMPMPLVEKLTELFMGEANEQIFEQVFDGCNEVCMYGEGFGANIQKGGGNYGAVDFVLFDVKIGDWWLVRKDVEEIAQKMDIKVAPIIAEGTLEGLSNIVAEGFDSYWGEFKAEGLVVRPEVELKKRNGDRIITKLKYRDFVKLDVK